MASADAMPVLMEHDITVVNTFVQVSEARPRQFLQRSQTAPEAALVMEEPTASEGDLHITGKAAEQKTDKEVIEESPESTEPVKTVKKLQTLRTLNRFETPDPWDLEALCKSLDEAPEEALPAKAGVSKPCLLHSATGSLLVIILHFCRLKFPIRKNMIILKILPTMNNNEAGNP